MVFSSQLSRVAAITIVGGLSLCNTNIKAQAFEFGCTTMYDTLQNDSLFAVLPPNICGNTIDYAPDPTYLDHTPIKTIRLVWHFMCDDNGGSNFNNIDLNTASPNAQSDYMIKVINGLNHRFSNLQEETRQDPNYPTPLIVDSRIRFEISQSNIFYHNNTTAIQNIGFGNYLTYFNQYVTNNQAVAYKDDAIHIFFYPHRFGNGSSWAHFAGNIVVHNGDFDDHFLEDRWFVTRNSLAHELGHCLGLHHTNRTGGGTCSSTIDDGCDDTPPAGALNPCPCWNGLASENGHTGDDEWCSTNMMTYNAQGWSLTRCQIGRMHHFLMNNSSVNKFWISDYCSHSPSETISIPNGQNMVWENSRYLKGDLIIESNATLTVKCYVSIPKNGKVVVKAGGKLIIDGGTLSNRCGEDWHGIFVEGNSNLNQMPLSNQGFVEIKNGAIIENAREAIFLAGLKSTGDIDYSKLGGIVKATNSTFRNNKRDVSFVSYKNTNSIGTEISNLSTFSNCLFVTTSETPFIDNIGAHITMWEVNGVRISGCTFEDQRTIIVKTQGRTGIGTINSTYLVTSYCSNPMMIPCTGTPSVFNNMRSALESRSNGTMGKITIENSEFNSYKGVFLQGINNARIVNNTFTIEHDILVPLNTDYPYGVYLDKCQMFNIEGNTFNGTTGQASPSNGGAAGLVIRNTGANNNLFYRNNFYNIKMASQALSENRATDLQTGLRFRCNDYQETYNDLDIRDDPNNPFTSFGRLGIAELQGIVGGGPPQLPDNQFGNTGSFLNFNIENQGNWVNYLYSGSASQGNRYYPWSVTPNVSRINYNEAPSCPNNLDFWGTDRHVLRDDIELIKPMVVVKANDWDMVTDGGNMSRPKKSLQFVLLNPDTSLQ